MEHNAFPSDRYAVQSQLKFHGNNPIDDLIILTPDDGANITTNRILDYFDQNGGEIAMATTLPPIPERPIVLLQVEVWV